MTTVLVVDDHPVVRAGLVALLSTRPGIEVVGQAGTQAEALSAFGRERPDVVLMDLQLGADDGVSATRRLRERDPHARVLILTTYDTDADIVNAIEAGAVGYLLKDASPDALGAAVEAAARGETVFAPAVAGRLARRVIAPPDELTEREREVVALLAQGLTNRQIAKQLFLSEATVKTHLVHIFTKLNVDNRTAAVAAAREQGLLR
ncbi:response regulator transcription factor [Propioniciclava coleopterorum]|uniref:Response regulator transcription factor n=1 Tax=Propioniciclava coleopterorum TaxID=2714937 RepID=A0A6G7YAB1_9ACTN|nr:response regulator transcription factor [Propioniciclava coleopterorum]QIK73581.1 response regulator transcription factor [Propioniciclava coleopterorum]